MLVVSFIAYNQTQEELIIDYSGDNGANAIYNNNLIANTMNKNGENGRNGKDLQIFLQHGKKNNIDYVYITCNAGGNIYSDTLTTIAYLTILSRGGNGGNGLNGSYVNYDYAGYKISEINNEANTNYKPYNTASNSIKTAMKESGSGGDGGNGGNVEVYYDEVLTSFLSHITIDVSPGIPGKYGKAVDLLYRGKSGNAGIPGTHKIVLAMSENDMLKNFSFLSPIR